MNRKWLATCVIPELILMIGCGHGAVPEAASSFIELPEPRFDSDASLEQCLRLRRSVRSYREAPLALSEVGQLLWAAQGITGAGGLRTAPSAGALYPLETLIVAGKVDGLAPGVYRYRPERHRLEVVEPGDHRGALSAAALGQESVRDAPLTVLFSAIYGRTTKKYGERGIRYVHIEAGHAAQNLCLQAAAFGLGVVTIGAFDDGNVKRIVGMPDTEQPLYLLPVGRK